MPTYRCLKHNEIMHEMIVSNKIKPYCFTCRIKDKLTEELKDYHNNKSYYEKQHKSITKSRYMDEVLLGSFKAFIVSIIIFNFFTALAFIKFSFIFSFLVSLILLAIRYVQIRGDRSIYSISTLDIVKEKMISESENNKREVEIFISKLHKEYTLKSIGLDIVDQMDGYEFEYYVASLLEKLGFREVKVTKKSGDSGVDIICYNPKGEKTGIQCKRQKAKVSNTAIQEVFLGKKLHKCTKAMIITNSYLTKPSFAAAVKAGVEVWSRKRLAEEMKKVEVQYSWDTFLKKYYDLPSGKKNY